MKFRDDMGKAFNRAMLDVEVEDALAVAPCVRCGGRPVEFRVHLEDHEAAPFVADPDHAPAPTIYPYFACARCQADHPADLRRAVREHYGLDD